MKHLLKTGDRCITQLAKLSIDPKFVELMRDVVRAIIKNMHTIILSICLEPAHTEQKYKGQNK